jgi:hypothetical protein
MDSYDGAATGSESGLKAISAEIDRKASPGGTQFTDFDGVRCPVVTFLQ